MKRTNLTAFGRYSILTIQDAPAYCVLCATAYEPMSDKPSSQIPAPSLQTTTGKSSRARRIGFRTLAVLIGLLPFVLFEVGLSVFGVGTPTDYVDPFVGFSRVHPLFELDGTAAVYRTTRSRLLNFESQQFEAAKPPGTFRIFCLGGSTVRGRPFETRTSFPEWLQIELNERDPSRHYQSVNCGGLSYASYRLLPVLEEVLNYEPDLIVVATGHNEFLEDRTYHSLKTRSGARQWIEDRAYSLRTVSLCQRLLGAAQRKPDKPILEEDVDPKLDHASGYASYDRDDEWRQSVVRHSELSLRAMVDASRQAGVPLVLVSLGANLRDCPPFKSEHKRELSPDRESLWQTAFDDATALEDKDPQAALALYEKAESLDDQHALLLYRVAHCLERLGRTGEAGPYYAKAKQWDICPLRVLDAITDTLRTIARETQTPLVDARRLLEELSADRIPGNDCYLDHVHPTVEAHQRIARAVASTMAEQGLWSPTKDWSDGQRRAAYRRHWRELGPNYLKNGQRRIEWLNHWARRKRLLRETLPHDTGGYVRLGHKLLDLGQTDDAWGTYRAGLLKDSSVAQDVMDHALALVRQGRPQAAGQLLDRLRQQAVDPAIQVEIELALLVIAVEEGDRSAAAAAIREAEPDCRQQLGDRADSWLSLVLPLTEGQEPVGQEDATQ